MNRVRQGVPHLYSTKTPAGNDTPSLSVEQFVVLTAGGKIHIADITEKTDGLSLVFGYDTDGFYTQHSGSGDERARFGFHHIDRAKMRSKLSGQCRISRAAFAMCMFHDALYINQKLQYYLTHLFHRFACDIVVRGEALSKHLASPGDLVDEVKFVHTSYHTKHLGDIGTFIVHTKLDENKQHRLHTINMSDNNIKFDHDIVDVPPGYVDVSQQVEQFNMLNRNLLQARTTKTNKQAKIDEQRKFNDIKTEMGVKVSDHLRQLGIENKWGSGTEGIIVHPCAANPQAPRFKVVSAGFKAAKAASHRFGN